MRHTHATRNSAFFTLNSIILILSCLAFACMTAGASTSELEIGKQWYERRSEHADGLVADPRPIDRAIYFLHKALEHRATAEEAGIFLLKSYYFKGEFATQGEEDKRRVFDKARALGEHLLDRFPNSPGLRLFYSANLGKWAENSGVLAVAESGIPDTIRENAEAIIRMDPDYDKGAGYYLLGAIHFRAPYIPFLLSWPDNRVAVANLEKALEMDPESLGAKLVLAQALLRQGDRQAGIRLLEDVSRETPREFRRLEDQAYIREAQSLLNENSG